MKPTPETPFFDINGVAEHFGVRRQAVHRWIRAGIIKGQHVGKFWHFTQDDLDRAGRRK